MPLFHDDVSRTLVKMAEKHHVHLVKYHHRTQNGEKLCVELLGPKRQVLKVLSQTFLEHEKNALIFEMLFPTAVEEANCNGNMGVVLGNLDFDWKIFSFGV